MAVRLIRRHIHVRHLQCLALRPEVMVADREWIHVRAELRVEPGIAGRVCMCGFCRRGFVGAGRRACDED